MLLPTCEFLIVLHATLVLYSLSSQISNVCMLSSTATVFIGHTDTVCLLLPMRVCSYGPRVIQKVTMSKLEINLMVCHTYYLLVSHLMFLLLTTGEIQKKNPWATDLTQPSRYQNTHCQTPSLESLVPFPELFVRQCNSWVTDPYGTKISLLKKHHLLRHHVK